MSTTTKVSCETFVFCFLAVIISKWTWSFDTAGKFLYAMLAFNNYDLLIFIVRFGRGQLLM